MWVSSILNDWLWRVQLCFFLGILWVGRGEEEGDLKSHAAFMIKWSYPSIKANTIVKLRLCVGGSDHVSTLFFFVIKLALSLLCLDSACTVVIQIAKWEKGKEQMKKKERIKTSTRSRDNKTTQQVWYFWVLDKILSRSGETDDPDSWLSSVPFSQSRGAIALLLIEEKSGKTMGFHNDIICSSTLRT